MIDLPFLIAPEIPRPDGGDRYYRLIRAKAQGGVDRKIR
jgi:hypothetical protein